MCPSSLRLCFFFHNSIFLHAHHHYGFVFVFCPHQDGSQDVESDGGGKYGATEGTTQRVGLSLKVHGRSFQIPLSKTLEN